MQFPIWNKIIGQRHIMDVGQVVEHIHVIIGLQAAQGGSVLQEVLVAEFWHDLGRDAEPLAHVLTDAFFDGLPQSVPGGVECVVEINEKG